MNLTDIKIQNPVFKKEFELYNHHQDYDLIKLEPSEENSNQSPSQEDQFKHEVTIPRYGKLLPHQINQISSKDNPICKYQINHTGYIKFFDLRNIYSKYQMRAADLNFIKKINKKYQQNEKLKLHQKTFAQIIQSCQDQLFAKKIKMQDSSDHIINNITFQIDSQLMKILTLDEKQQLKQIFKQVINYWKKIKIQFLNFPLLRKNWPRTQISMMKCGFQLPFKSRFLEDQNKKNLQYAMKGLVSVQKQSMLAKFTKPLTKIKSQINQMISINLKQSNDISKTNESFHSLAQPLISTFSSNLNIINQNRKQQQRQKRLQNIVKSTKSSHQTIKFLRKFHSNFISSQFQLFYDPNRKLFKQKQIVRQQQDGEIKISRPRGRPRVHNVLKQKNYKRLRNRLHEQSIRQKFRLKRVKVE